MEIKILGTGCPNCKMLEKLVKEVVEEHAINAKVIMVQDIMEIMSYQVMSTPALVIDEQVKVKGRVPKRDEILKLLIAQQ